MVLQCSMDFMKVECGQDGVMYETSGRDSYLIEVKEEKDPLLTFSELKTETEVSCASIVSETCNNKIFMTI
jgi:hypothetical protein